MRFSRAGNEVRGAGFGGRKEALTMYNRSIFFSSNPLDLRVFFLSSWSPVIFVAPDAHHLPRATPYPSPIRKKSTWEERDVTSWARETLIASLLRAPYVLPNESPSPGSRCSIFDIRCFEGRWSRVVGGRAREEEVHI